MYSFCNGNARAETVSKLGATQQIRNCKSTLWSERTRCIHAILGLVLENKVVSSGMGGVEH
jgi:hypothetical protein